MSGSIYTRLTPAKRSVFGSTRLWLAPDHIMLLISSRFAEDYKRFAFADIQSIVVTESPSRVVPQVAMVLAAVVWMSLWFAVHLRFFKWTFLVTGALALLWSIVDIARGQRCRCYLHTRVSKELLAPVSRMSIARRFVATVRPRIETAQGVLLAEQVVETASPQAAPPEIVSSPGYTPEVLFAVFLLDALLIGASVLFPKTQEIAGILVNSLIAELLLMLVALLRRKGRDRRVIIYVVIALSMVAYGFDATAIGRELFGWYLTVLEKTKNGDKSGAFLTLLTGRHAVIAYSWRAAAGAIGLAAAFYERRK